MTTHTFASFEGISKALRTCLATQGITTPFPIQERVIPLALRGEDVLAQAPTGSGKTLAFGLAMIARLAPKSRQRPAGRNSNKRRAVQSLVLVPTRELAMQVCADLQPLAAAERLRIAAAFGGSNVRRQAIACASADIVIATPGRLNDLLDRGDIALDAVRVLVLDEADRMLDMGFAPQVDTIVRRMPKRRQTMLFSATLDGAVSKLVQRYTTSPATIRVNAPVDNEAGVEHVFQSTMHHTRVDSLVELLDQPRDLAVVFVRTKRGADRLSKRLRTHGMTTATLHGGMTQSRRTRELSCFRSGDRSTLVATDVFARGIDLDNITHVINYDPPEDADAYRHRVGRTGRAGRGGTGITLVTDDQLPHMLAIADEIGLREDC